MNFAQMTVSGNVGASPEIKDVNGTKVANFSVAVNENYKNKKGEKVENTHWYRVEAWDSNADGGLVSGVIEKFITAGTQVLVQGTPIVETYEKDGEKRTAFKLKLAGGNSTLRLGSKSSGGDATAKPSAPSPDADDIPF